MQVQVRLETSLTSEQYVTEEAWRRASLDRCPLHPDGGCGMRRHGTYARQAPPGARVARWYCRKGQRTFSLLPDCLAAKLAGSLAEIERVVARVEQGGTVEAAVDELRPDVELPGALRWVRRRLGLVYSGLLSLRTLLPAELCECAPTVFALRARLGTEPVLPALRALGGAHLDVLPPPLGFGPRSSVRLRALRRAQQRPGARGPPRAP